MKTQKALLLGMVSLLLLLHSGVLSAEVVCREVRPLKPVHCLSGKLIDPSGAPISGALVKVNQGGTEIGSATSGMDGSFSFPGLRAGDYDLAADFDGLRPFRSAIVIKKPSKRCAHQWVIVLEVWYPDNCGSYVINR